MILNEAAPSHYISWFQCFLGFALLPRWLPPWWPKDLRGTFCCPSIMFHFVDSFEASGQSLDWSKSELSLVSKSKPELFFNCILVITDNNQGVGCMFHFFLSSLHFLTSEPTPGSWIQFQITFVTFICSNWLQHNCCSISWWPCDHPRTKGSLFPTLSFFLFPNHLFLSQYQSSKSHFWHQLLAVFTTSTSYTKFMGYFFPIATNSSTTQTPPECPTI